MGQEQYAYAEMEQGGVGVELAEMVQEQAGVGDELPD